MEQRKVNMESLGFLKGFDANKFIGRNIDLHFLPIDISLDTFMDFVKPVRTLNGVIEARMLSSHTSKYELLTKLQECDYTVNQIFLCHQRMFGLVYKDCSKF